MSKTPTIALLALATFSLTACELGTAGGDPAQTPKHTAAAVTVGDVADLSVMLANVVGSVAPAADEGRDEPADSEDPSEASCPVMDWSWSEITLDYGAGCVPDNGWTEEIVSGSVTLALQGEDPVMLAILFDAYTVGGESSDGYVAGGIVLATDDAPFTVVLELDLERTDAGGTTSSAGDLALGFPADAAFVVDGSLDYTGIEGNSSAVVGTALVWGFGPYPTCALPESGTMDITVGNSTVTATFTEDSPLTGEVQMSSGWLTWTAEPCPVGETA